MMSTAPKFANTGALSLYGACIALYRGHGKLTFENAASTSPVTLRPGNLSRAE